MADRQRLLIVDDDPDIGALFVQAGEGMGFETMLVDRPVRILEAVRSFAPDLIVLDLMMPDVDGVEVLRVLSEERNVAEIILISGAGARVLNTAARLGESHGLTVREILQKPIALDDLEAALARHGPPTSGDPKAELEAAISNREICVHYQPKVELTATGAWSITGLEALARWRHPSRGLVCPGEFIPLAEETGLIGGVTDLVIDQAIRQARLLRENGYSLDVAVNLSPLVAVDPKVPDRLGRMLAEHRVESSRFVVEITESATVGDGILTMENLTRFRLKGMKLSMDDFGTGYSSLVQLYRMPFSELKIDKSFVMELESSEEARIVVRSIVDLAHNLDLTVCAEGVETQEELDFLRSVGCDQAQGYFISKPVDQAGLDRILKSGSAPTSVGNAAAGS